MVSSIILRARKEKSISGVGIIADSATEATYFLPLLFDRFFSIQHQILNKIYRGLALHSIQNILAHFDGINRLERSFTYVMCILNHLAFFRPSTCLLYCAVSIPLSNSQILRIFSSA